MAPDVKGVHHTIQAGMHSVGSEFKFLPDNLLQPQT